MEPGTPADSVEVHAPPVFGQDFRGELASLIAWRRDVRRFRRDPVEPGLVRSLLELAALAPSVGNSQPWRFVTVEADERRAAVAAEFERCNAGALRTYDSERAENYRRLKLEGLREAPVHLAAFCDETTAAGHGLGRATMPETLRYSVVGAIQTFWLAARAHGLGVGWVSILDPCEIRTLLEVPESWSLVAYLCVGYPAEEHLDPELVRHRWQERLPLDALILRR
jgi:5,6-dimethylbenzimidazole synthase